MVLEAPYGKAKNLERFVEAGRQMAAEMHMVGHDDMAEEADAGIDARNGLERFEHLLAKRRQDHGPLLDPPEEAPPRLGGNRDKKGSALAVIPASKSPIAAYGLLGRT